MRHPDRPSLDEYRRKRNFQRTPEPAGTGKTTPVFPKERIDRQEIKAYYSEVASLMLPYLRNRPLTLIVCPTNIFACKFTKHATNLPWPVIPLDVPGHAEKYLAVDTAEGLLTLVDHGAVEFHAWQSRSPALEFPDRMVFDLDPPEEGFPWEHLGEAALRLRIGLQRHGLECFLQTTGGKGYYVVVPITAKRGWQEVTAFARRFAEEMERTSPSLMTARLAKDQRGERIYVDWMRNGRGADAAEPFSLRAQAGAPVSTPITWEELVSGTRPDSFTLRGFDVHQRAEADPWKDFFSIKQELP